MSESSSVPDLSALRAKWAQVAQQRDAAVGGLAQTPASLPQLADAAGQPPAKEEVNVKICRGCEGLGIARTIYNHRVMERTCDVCEGEGVVAKPAAAAGGAAAGTSDVSTAAASKEDDGVPPLEDGH